MKKIIYTVLFTLITFTFFNCGSVYVNKNSDKWFAHELRPSEVKYNGEIFSYGRLNDGTSFGIKYDKTIYNDRTFYYMKLMSDFGWHENTQGGWSGHPYLVRSHKFGNIYVNPKRGVGLYFNPSNEKYSAFKVIFRE